LQVAEELKLSVREVRQNNYFISDIIVFVFRKKNGVEIGFSLLTHFLFHWRNSAFLPVNIEILPLQPGNFRKNKILKA